MEMIIKITVKSWLTVILKVNWIDGKHNNLKQRPSLIHSKWMNDKKNVCIL